MPGKPLLQVYQAGKLTVVGFGGREILDDIDLNDCRAEILELIERHSCQTLAIDLTAVKVLPSGMLGMMASLPRVGVEVHVYNPSNDVRDVLAITRLDQILQVHRVEV